MRRWSIPLIVLLVLPGANAVRIPSDPAHPGIGLPLLAPKLYSDEPAAWSIAVDSHGNVILGAEISIGNNELRKYDSTGNLLWRKSFGDTYAISVMVDSLDNIIAASATLHKLDPGGNVLWTIPISSINRLATDAQGNVYASADEASNGKTIVYKFSPSGVTLWRTAVGGINDNANGIAVAPDGYSAVVSYLQTSSLDPNGNVLWRAQPGGYTVAIDANHNVYTSRTTSVLLFGFLVSGYVAKFSSTGTKAWQISEPGTFIALAGTNLVVTDELRYGGLLPNPIPGAKGWVVDAYDTNTGVWQWGFKHVTGTWGGFDALIAGNAYYRPGYLAITGTGFGTFDSPVYQMDGLAHVCDSTPLMSTPDAARACVFTPV